MSAPLAQFASLHAPFTLAMEENEMKMVVVIGIIALIAVLAVLHTVRKTTEVSEREKTRREVAAYVAEGSISPDDAARLLHTGMSEAVASELARGVTWGTVSAKRAQEMVRAIQTPPGAAVPPPQA